MMPNTAYSTPGTIEPRPCALWKCGVNTAPVLRGPACTISVSASDTNTTISNRPSTTLAAVASRIPRCTRNQMSSPASPAAGAHVQVGQPRLVFSALPTTLPRISSPPGATTTSASRNAQPTRNPAPEPSPRAL